MAGTNILLNVKRGDEVCVYAYTGTWLADFAMNHYTHWVGLLLKVFYFGPISLLTQLWFICTNYRFVGGNLLINILFIHSPMKKNAITFWKKLATLLMLESKDHLWHSYRLHNTRFSRSINLWWNKIRKSKALFILLIFNYKKVW